MEHFNECMTVNIMIKVLDVHTNVTFCYAGEILAISHENVDIIFFFFLLQMMYFIGVVFVWGAL